MNRYSCLKMFVIIVYLLNILPLLSYASSTLKLEIDEITKLDSKQIRVPIVMQNQLDVRGLQFDLGFNRSKLTMKRVVVGDMASGFTQVHKITDSYFRVIVYNFSGGLFKNGRGTVVNIDFELANSVKMGEAVNFDFEKVVIPNSNSKNMSQLADINGKTFNFSGLMFPQLLPTPTPTPTPSAKPTSKYTIKPGATVKATATPRPTFTPRTSYTLPPWNTPTPFRSTIRSTATPLRSTGINMASPAVTFEAWELLNPNTNSSSSQGTTIINGDISDTTISGTNETNTNDSGNVIKFGESNIASNNAGSTNIASDNAVAEDGVASEKNGDLSILLSADSLKYMEGAHVNYKIRYNNKSNFDMTNIKIKAIIPENTMALERNNGTLFPGFIEWAIPLLLAKESGEINYVVKVLKLPQEEVKVNNEVTIQRMDELKTIVNKEDDISKVTVLCFKKDGKGKHVKMVNGFPDGTFKPDKLISRAEFAAITGSILDYLDRNFEDTENIEFTDVGVNHWAYNSIKKLSSKGIFKGGKDNEFNPDAYLTRGELSVIVAKLIGLANQYFDRDSFIDTGSHWARNFIEEVFRNKIISGYTDKSFLPNKSVSRAEAVTIIDRMLYRGPLHTKATTFKDVESKHWALGYIEEAAANHEYLMNEDGSELEQ